ncbi:low affinity immunoglobulin gamma Fc region receptor II-like isoform X2 [Boleophthalmus pectinirostris]|uniref:low affinity immunoglobulin gamma Fc region receptor II-like isoform X2 n=1 Tax=Boleophthalmus pectinirostris TaxID=150288 RepID=UPI00242CF6A8|nr:low affinity immunoglobulin gamma Fc region receptor II-like isoform X2 [Boleophthalmus pectinirostris]
MGAVSLFLLTTLLFYITDQDLLVVRPGRSQFFQKDTVEISCKDNGWKVKRNTSKSARTHCENWATWNPPTCTIYDVRPRVDTGVYWCENPEGQSSDTVHITVTDKQVLLQSPVLPVTEGQNMTLLCQHKTSSTMSALFYKDGQLLKRTPTARMTLPHVQMSDGGRYWCEMEREQSEPSHITVIGSAQDKTKPQTSCPAALTTLPPAPPARPPVVALVCHLLVLCPYIISTGLMLSLYCHKPTEYED